MIEQARAALREHIEPEKAAFFPKFMQAFPGGYGEGDKFLGVRVPSTRAVAKRYPLPLEQIEELLASEYHEERQLGLFMLINAYKKAKTEAEQQRLFDCYLDNLVGVNNWDLVDCSAPHLFAPHVWKYQQWPQLERMAHSKQLWQERIAMVSCFYFMRQGDSEITLRLAEQFHQHAHPLMHKAVGWMLRELAKREQALVEAFLQQHLPQLPRELLRYSIEKFEPLKRQAYLSGEILSAKS